MSTDGRTSVASVSDEKADGGCAAGTFPTRLVPRPNRKPLDLAQRLALSALVVSGRMIRRTDGFGTAETTLIPTALAAFLKGRRYAVPAFDGNTIYPSDKAKSLHAEGNHAP